MAEGIQGGTLASPWAKLEYVNAMNGSCTPVKTGDCEADSQLYHTVVNVLWAD